MCAPMRTRDEGSLRLWGNVCVAIALSAHSEAANSDVFNDLQKHGRRIAAGTEQLPRHDRLGGNGLRHGPSCRLWGRGKKWCPKIATVLCPDSRRGKGHIVTLCNLCRNAEAGSKDKQNAVVVIFRGPYSAIGTDRANTA